MKDLENGMKMYLENDEVKNRNKENKDKILNMYL